MSSPAAVGATVTAATARATTSDLAEANPLDPQTTAILPEQTVQMLHEHVLRPDSPVTMLTSRLASLATQLVGTVIALLSPILLPALDKAMASLQGSPDVVILIMAVVALAIFLQVVFFIQRAMMWATRLAFRLAGWALVFALIAAVWRRGPEAAARDAVALVARLAGYVAVVRDIWWSEYQRYDAQTRASAGASAATAGYGSGYSGGYGAPGARGRY